MFFFLPCNREEYVDTLCQRGLKATAGVIAVGAAVKNIFLPTNEEVQKEAFILFEKRKGTHSQTELEGAYVMALRRKKNKVFEKYIHSWSKKLPMAKDPWSKKINVQDLWSMDDEDNAQPNPEEVSEENHMYNHESNYERFKNDDYYRRQINKNGVLDYISGN
mmetsp:Transcript_7437/g.14636  ORF Transcript_7437/g.14636 Transcript_7437/m.14636 type:complete len:163 (-) Transcript_7437:307-795(-)|eukprot:CAMPEP_0175065156 /NCGR_PEP_ID=MMETSP0052_2-20121109/15754_1 /TAXON_ID=51329 ORGANISM="Polytomella parva, Strain SAG 63-3" /NCGR_SAMPLE_ID=MMETSP0052_2 /ASSEMBLY_ACC=CAM_ASM_000194 /LENGTH=162 /DNA_ID=CAMNT_0016331631 /DNA_START=105 /DNA_END=593 /DNA_ORIENTATION=+